MSSLSFLKTKIPLLRSLLTPTAARSTTLPRLAIGSLQHRNIAANVTGTPNTNDVPDKPSPITQACYKLPKNKAFSTFLYHKLSGSEIPTSWSNSPAVLEIAIDLHTFLEETYGRPLQAPMPIAVKLVDGPADQEKSIQQYLFEAGGSHYLYSGPIHLPPYGIVQRVTKPASLESVLEILRTKGEGALGKVTLEKPLKSKSTKLKNKVVEMMDQDEINEHPTSAWK
ncbi:hypothetical protein N7G274_004674 [Stereocaulon virgatum]|uniref:Uncharacterized protein n=1 Tax=Stereocaulon virgatum TaxID=373712 RepID=A0ABR4AAL0_9LECA